MEKRKISWTKEVVGQFNAAIKYIWKYSDQNTDKVKDKILKKVGELADRTFVHRTDPYKKNNDGNFLYFEILKYRVVYYAKADEVIIIRIRRTSMEPQEY